MKYGYARVSTDGQSVAAQVATLKSAGADKVFKEVASGAKTDRAQLHRLLNVLDEGDVLLVTRLDRLARSTRDLLNTLAAIAAKKAGFRSLGDSWADTITAHGRLMLTILAGLAVFERELIRARTSEGRERAKARGVKLGRKFKLTPHQQREARARRDRGEALTEIGRSYNVSHSTIIKALTNIAVLLWYFSSLEGYFAAGGSIVGFTPIRAEMRGNNGAGNLCAQLGERRAHAAFLSKQTNPLPQKLR